MDFNEPTTRESIIWCIVENRKLVKAYTDKRKAHDYYQKNIYSNAYEKNIYPFPLKFLREGLHPDDKDEIPIFVILLSSNAFEDGGGGNRLIKAFDSKEIANHFLTLVKTLAKDGEVIILEVPLIIDHTIYGNGPDYDIANSIRHFQRNE